MKMSWFERWVWNGILEKNICSSWTTESDITDMYREIYMKSRHVFYEDNESTTIANLHRFFLNGCIVDGLKPNSIVFDKVETLQTEFDKF